MQEFWTKTKQYYLNNITAIQRIFVIFCCGLFFVGIGARATSEPTAVSANWQTEYNLLTKPKLQEVSASFINAYQAQDTATLENVVYQPTLATIYDNEQKKQALIDGIITMFGGKDMLSEEALSAISQFVNDLPKAQIANAHSTGYRIRDNIGKISFKVESRPDTSILTELDLNEKIATITANYADTHKDELVNLYTQTKDQNAITKAVIQGVYKDVLQAFKEAYTALPAEEQNCIITVSEVNDGAWKVSDLTKEDKNP